MKITESWLKEKSACPEGLEWFNSQKESDSIKVLNTLIKSDKLDWANWLIVRVMKRKQYLSYAIFAAEQVLGIYEKKYPTDKRPREAIEAARKCLEENTQANRAAAYAAYAAAYAVANAAYAAAYAVANAAYAAAYAAANAAAANADYAAANAAYAAAKKKMQLKILDYGMKLLKE